MFLERRLSGRGRLLITVSAITSLLGGLCSSAEAHYHHRHHHYWRVARHVHYRHHHAPHRFWEARHRRIRHFVDAEAPSRLAEIVVDANTDRVLYAQNENALRHPASLTKVMTLYLLFQQLDRGRLHLNSRIVISAHAAAQAPTKLGLRPGQTIDVDDAIKAVVTRSANDIAVAIAEAIGGSESNFCVMMTREAHALGMEHTRYVNASGLPNDGQITTAADLAILGRAMQQRFPQYFHYFSLREFAYKGREIRNHNHLLGHVAGLDGIKTGYTAASGFNLLTSVHRDGRSIVAVVLGGATAAGRDRVMAALIDHEIDDASTRHTAPMIAEVARERGEARDFAPVREARATQRDWVKRAEALSNAAIPLPSARPRPAYISGTPVSEDAANDLTTGTVRRSSDFDGSTARTAAATTTPSTLHWVVGPAPAKIHEASYETAPARETRDAEITVKRESRRDSDTEQQPPVSGWMIQIGATDDRTKADELLARAKARGLSALGDAHPFTQKVQKGDTVFYRARFAGLDAGDAEAACRSLKRSGFACFTMKN